MTLDTDDEILQDFLVEAGEILEGLNEQLVELENSPQDSDLLNAIFRGFHTIKGGAGFLSLDAMVNLCHKGEDVFNLLRQGERFVDAEMMDTFLKVLDILNTMFDEIKSGQHPTPADPAILDQLAAYLKARPDRVIVFVGHTDATGSLAANQALSLRRATSAVDYLRDRHGITRAQISADGVGYLSPIATNLTEEGRIKNRRVEAVLISTE